MSAKNKWIGAAAIAALLAAAIVFVRREPSEQPAPATPSSAAAAGPARSTSRPAAAAAAAAPVPAAPVPGAPPPDAPRAMPYRPAKYLLYSEDRPAREAGAGDDSQPVLQRIFDVAQADPAQQVKIREFWHAHENGRRVLWNEAYPRVSGPRVLDAEKLEQLDLDFENAVFGILQPAQKQALAREVPPAGMPHTPQPKMYANPNLEQ